MRTREYWLSLNPNLTITDQPFLSPPSNLNTQRINAEQYTKQMKQEGYCKLDGILSVADMDRMADGLINLVNDGYPPVFAYVYDEFWRVFRDIAPVVEPIFGEHYRLSTNRWAWYISASGENAGFAPHRDMVGCPHPVMRADGLPLIATVWIPLRDVTPENACMHVLPIDKDPHVPDNMTSTTIPQECIQNIRALPCKAGSVLSWNPHVLHWGSRSSKWTDEPRVSIATYLLCANGPNFTSIGTEAMQPMTLDFRLGVIGRVVSHYDSDAISNDRYSPQLIKFCDAYHFCEPGEKRFDPSGKPQEAKAPHLANRTKAARNDPCPCGSGKKYKHCHGK